MKTIYADYAAAAPAFESVRVRAGEAIGYTGNPSAPHALGRELRERLEGARRSAARFAHARQEHVVFTSSGSEANSIALRGAVSWGPGDALVISAIEHPSVFAVAEELSKIGVEVRVLPVGKDGRIVLNGIESYIDARVRMVSVMHANNETGVVQPIEEVYRQIRTHTEALNISKPLFHTDACQSAPWGLLSRADEYDFVSFNSVKCHGPLGVGVLVARASVPHPLVRGGGQEWGIRGGSENVSGILGLEAALGEVAANDPSGDAVAQLRDALWERVHAADDSIIKVGTDPTLPGHLCLVAPGALGEETMLAMEKRGVCVGVGAACQSGKGTSSHVLVAMGVSASLATHAIRVSIGRGVSSEDVVYIADTYLASVAEVRSRYQSVSAR
ncbi:MAG: aminotransferase class V-fold PLP-dependent enzyme [Patescibacteria group bacterium]